ncbi:MAG: CRISPR-associated endonuclease Cas1 [Nitrososphaerota archaeon]
MRRLIINGYGAFVGYKKGLVTVKKKDGNESVPLGNLDQIVITTSGAAISSKLIRTCLKNKVEISILSSSGRPLGKVFSITKSHVKLRLAQIEARRTSKGARIAKKIVYSKIRGQSNFLKSLAKNRTGESKDNILKTSERIDQLSSQLQELPDELSEIRQRLVSIEADAARAYWDSIAGILPAELGFSARKKRFEGPKDPVNISLNYGYGVLASEVYTLVEYSGLDPWFGFLHEDSCRRPALVYDIMELFRAAVVDRVVVTLALRSPNTLLKAIDATSGRLERDFRGTLLKEIFERLEQGVSFGGQQKPIYAHMLSQIRELARYLLDHSHDWKAFVLGW